MKVSSYTAGGLATGNMPYMSLSTESLSSKTKSTTRTSNQRGTKKLNYNPREISSAILRASKAQTAGRVAVLAKNKLGMLMRCKGTGQYNDGEVNMAIAHAKRMVQCAQIKTQNLRQEERMKKRHEQEAKTEQHQEKNKIKAQAARQEKNLDQKNRIEHMQMVEKQKSLNRELIRKKKFHRNQERGKVNEADMKYLKAQLRELQEPYSASAGVVVDLSAQALGQAEAQIEQQVKASQADAAVTSTALPGGAISSAPVPSVDIII